MTRFLFVVPPLVGHVNPTVSVALELVARGHEVAWASEPSVVRPLLPDSAMFFEAPPRLPESMEDALRHRGEGVRGAAGLKFLWEEALLPLALAMQGPLSDAVDTFAPDVIVADQQAVAGAITARQRGLPWATSATTSAEFSRPFEAIPKIGEWVAESLVDVQLRFGVDEADARKGDLRFSDHLVLAFTAAALVGDVDTFPDHYEFVGPSTSARVETTAFPWEWLDPDRALVLVSLGTVNQSVGGRFFAAAAEALADLAVDGTRVQGIIVAPPELVGTVPDNVVVQPYVPQLALLPHVQAVVSHGGHNTTCETLAHGIPLVIAPIRDDQPIVAQQVVAAGAGVRVKFGRVSAAGLATALTQVLNDPGFRDAAGVVQASFAAAGGAPRAADHLEKLVS